MNGILFISSSKEFPSVGTHVMLLSLRNFTATAKSAGFASPVLILVSNSSVTASKREFNLSVSSLLFTLTRVTFTVVTFTHIFLCSYL